MTRYQLTEIAHGVAQVRIATDDDPYVHPDDVLALRGLVGELARSRVRALLLEGGDRHFCAGATRDTLLDVDAAEQIHALVAEAARAILDLPVPTVAVMSGHALGGGWMFGLWCDAAFMANEALYGANFVDLGFTPGMGSTTLLPEVVGPVLARDLLLTGRVVTGAELAVLAPSLGHRIVPRAEVRARALALAEDLARPPLGAVRMAKAHLASQRRARLEAALADEREMHRQIFASAETREHIAENYARTA